jgi:O-antigen/teichoic acid export membrane protein
MVAFFLGYRVGLTPGLALGCWASGSIVASALGVAQTKLRPTTHVHRWWHEHLGLGSRYSAEFLLTIGVSYVLTLTVALLGGLRDSAGLRGAQVLMGPLHVLSMGISMQALPAMARQAATAPERIVPTARIVSGTLVLLVALWGVVLVVVPDSWGEGLLGETWAVASPLLVPFTWLYAATAASTGALIGLRALADARRSLATRLIASPVTVLFGVVGALVAGPVGVVVGLAAAGTLALVAWWIALDRSIHTRRSGPRANEITATHVPSAPM